MSFLNVAIEQYEDVKEIEYSQFLKLSEEQLADAIGRFKSCRRMVFSESKLPDEAGRTRLRHYIEGDSSNYELTTKVDSGEAKTKDEYNVELPLEVYRALNALAISQVFRIRLFIPITKDGQAVMRRSGKPLEWELDLYISARSMEEGYSFAISNWVKLEMEVDSATLDNVVEYIPMDYDQIIISDSKDPVERAQISHLYNEEYNVLNKINDDAIRQFSNV